MAAQPFRAVWSVLSSDALVARVLSQHSLASRPSCELIHAGLNDTYRVQCGAATYYLRVYVHGWRDLRDIKAEVELLNHLHAHELPISHPIATRDGEYIVPLNACEGSRHAVLFSPAEGQRRDMNDHRSYVFGRLIGQIHSCADRMTKMPERLHIDLDYLLASALPSIEPFLRHRQGDYDYLADIAPRLRARVEELLSEGPSSREPAAYGIIHGDPHPWNVRFLGGDSPTLFDFDCFGYGWRVFDLAMLGMTLDFVDWGRKGKTNRTRRLNLAIRGYEEHRTLTGPEHEALKVFAPMILIWAMGMHAAKLTPRLGGDWLDDDYFDEFMGCIRGWIDHYRVL